jgi:hypothetical protein
MVQYFLMGAIFGALFAPASARSFDRKAASEPTASVPVYPLKKSANGRYLVDQKGVPFLIAGDSPQALMVNIAEAEADMYFANRKSHGFNAVWINLLCRPGTGGRKDGSTRDGVRPLKTAEDLSTPNEAYFVRCDRMIGLAAKHGLLVILDPCETIDHLKLMLDNGPAKCRAFGRYLGNRYKRFDNILWMSGNDFGTWQDARHDAVVTALALGIRDKDPGHLHTVELYGRLTSSLDDPKWAPIIGLNASYTFFGTYAQVLKDYNRKDFQPVCLIEAYYEFENGSTPLTLRRQEYWANLSGAAGQVYGSGVIYPFSSAWKEKLDSPGAVQMKYVQALFEPRAWYKLVPDQKHTVVVGGYGTFDATSTEANHYGRDSDYVTAGRTPDGSLVMAYMPTLRPLIVDMSKLRGPARAQWYDPSRGVYTLIKGSPLPNLGKRTFTPPGKNADGEGDWVLVLENAARH